MEDHDDLVAAIEHTLQSRGDKSRGVTTGRSVKNNSNTTKVDKFFTSFFSSTQTSRPIHRALPEEPTEWDLSSLYPEPAAPIIAADLAAVKKECLRFASLFEGRINQLSAWQLLATIQTYESISDRMGRIGSYVGLSYSQDMTDPERLETYKVTGLKLHEIAANLIFYESELAQLGQETIAEFISICPDLARYESWFRDVRLENAHQLTQDEEGIELKRSQERHDCLERYNRIQGNFRFNFLNTSGPQLLPLETALSYLGHSNRRVRASAASEISKVLAESADETTSIINQLLRLKARTDTLRQFHSPESARHLANRLDASMVNTLEEVVVHWYPRVPHKYFSLKKRLLGLEVLEFWDLHAPLPHDEQRVFSWTEARNLLLETFNSVSPEVGAIATRFFQEGWIDATTRHSKATGAFSASTVPSANPFVLTHFSGRFFDLLTLAGMLGHGIHQFLAARQGALLAPTPVTLANTASSFFETLVFARFLASIEREEVKKFYLARYVEHSLGTVFRQIAYYRFERQLHQRWRAEGSIGVEEIGRCWINSIGDYLGPEFHLGDEYGVYWSHVAHFFHTPFYSYTHAFGGLLSLALFAEHLEVLNLGRGTTDRRILDLFKAGGAKTHSSLLAPFGFEASERKFWEKGLTTIEQMINRLYNMMA